LVAGGIDTSGLWLDPNSHFSITASVEAGLYGEADILEGLVGGRLAGGLMVGVTASVGLTAPTPGESKMHLSELFQPGQSIVDDLLNDFHVDLSGEFFVHAEVDWTAAWGAFGGTAWSHDWDLGSFALSLHHTPQLPAVPGTQTSGGTLYRLTSD